jgi:hypothetical protein
LVQRAVKKIFCSEKRSVAERRGLFGVRYNLSYGHIYCLLELCRVMFSRGQSGIAIDNFTGARLAEFDKIVKEAKMSLISPGGVSPGVSAGFHANRAGYLDNAILAAGYPLINKASPAARPSMVGHAWPFARILGTAEN